MFTIEVKKKGKNEEFGFEDLEMFHKECGGQIKPKSYHVKGYHSEIHKGFMVLGSKEAFEEPVNRNLWVLTCQRCRASIEIEVEPEFEATKVIATAVDGEEREITQDIVVVQKI